MHCFDRYRQILEKALQFTDAEQLEALKAFVEASKYTNIQYASLTILIELNQLNMRTFTFLSLHCLNWRASLFLTLAQWSMRTSAWSYPDSCWQIFARTFQTYQTALRKPSVTSRWRRSSPESSHLKNRYVLKNILGTGLESYGSYVSQSHTLPGGFDQTASSHNLWERGGLEERCTGSCGNPAGDGSEVRFCFSLGTNWSSLFASACHWWLVCCSYYLYSDFFWYMILQTVQCGL